MKVQINKIEKTIDENFTPVAKISLEYDLYMEPYYDIADDEQLSFYKKIIGDDIIAALVEFEKLNISHKF